MAETKRGRPSKPEAEKRQQIGVRTSSALKADLERAAAENGRSVAQEAELRLVHSFDAERRDGSGETSRLLNMIANEIVMCERETGKRWSRDLKTWAAVAEICQNGPIQRMRPDHWSDDDIVSAAWGNLWTIIEEKRPLLDELRGAGFTAELLPRPGSQGGSAGVLSSVTDINRDTVRNAVRAADLPAEIKAGYLAIINRLVELDQSERDATAAHSVALQPYMEAEAEGRRLYREQRREQEQRATALAEAMRSKGETPWR